MSNDFDDLLGWADGRISKLDGIKTAAVHTEMYAQLLALRINAAKLSTIHSLTNAVDDEIRERLPEMSDEDLIRLREGVAKDLGDTTRRIFDPTGAATRKGPSVQVLNAGTGSSVIGLSDGAEQSGGEKKQLTKPPLESESRAKILRMLGSMDVLREERQAPLDADAVEV